MTVTSWRIVKSKYARWAMSGEGARAKGGRWNSPGTPLVYTAGSISLATLEILVHLQSPALLGRFCICSVMYDERLVERLAPRRLPRNWRRNPPSRSTQRLGDEWARLMRSAVLAVPSAIVQSESNYLINPAHPNFGELVIGRLKPFRLDPRLA